MPGKRFPLCTVMGTTLLAALAWTAPAPAAKAVFHYVPVDQCGNTTLQPSPACGSPGEKVSWFGMAREPYSCQPRPNKMVTYRHPFTGANVTVPIAFPCGTPVIEHRGNRTIYNYGTYTVEVVFLPGGSVDVVYNSGLFRAL